MGIISKQLCICQWRRSIESKHPEGDENIGNCQAECDIQSKCSAFEWYENGKQGTKCFLVLTESIAVKGSSGSSNSPLLDGNCYIKPG